MARATSASTSCCLARSTPSAAATRGPPPTASPASTARTGELDTNEDIVCTVYGSFDDIDHEADDHALEALRETIGSSR